jgi:SAM-dependent methyltransferase
MRQDRDVTDPSFRADLSQGTAEWYDAYRPPPAPVEELDAPPGAFDLVTIGNAFHRLPRDVVAAKIRRWLGPGGHLALLWGNGPRPATRRGGKHCGMSCTDGRTGTGPTSGSRLDMTRPAALDETVTSWQDTTFRCEVAQVRLPGSTG